MTQKDQIIPTLAVKAAYISEHVPPFGLPASELCDSIDKAYDRIKQHRQQGKPGEMADAAIIVSCLAGLCHMASEVALAA